MSERPAALAITFMAIAALLLAFRLGRAAARAPAANEAPH